MTREEIKQEAEERVNICTPYHTGSFIQGYIAGAEPRENKIADIKANCDLAIEGRDIKITELEKQIEKMKCYRNCRHPKTPIDNSCVDCENYSKWELRR